MLHAGDVLPAPISMAVIEQRRSALYRSRSSVVPIDLSLSADSRFESEDLSARDVESLGSGRLRLTPQSGNSETSSTDWMDRELSLRALDREQGRECGVASESDSDCDSEA